MSNMTKIVISYLLKLQNVMLAQTKNTNTIKCKFSLALVYVYTHKLNIFSFLKFSQGQCKAINH